MDRNYGQTGDYWYLDTQPGHSYRVEVTFGASPAYPPGDRPGSSFSIQTASIMRPSCCESDHNREDGHTFVHFTHSRQSREWNRSYLLHGRSLRPAQRGSGIYNGPYTITMTDITGVQQMVHSFSGGTTHPATDLLESGEDTGDIAVSFRTGPHNADGYTLDRIKVLFNSYPRRGRDSDSRAPPGCQRQSRQHAGVLFENEPHRRVGRRLELYAAPHLPRHLLRQRYPHRQHHVLDRVPG